MAVLVAFSGLFQPILQFLAAMTICYMPLTRATRERMLTVQELTCKIPLSSFYVEAYLLEVFKFKVSGSPETTQRLCGRGLGAGLVASPSSTSEGNQMWG